MSPYYEGCGQSRSEVDATTAAAVLLGLKFVGSGENML